MSAITLSGDIALVAIFLLTTNILLGLLISTRYSPVRSWPHRQINTFKLHNWTGYVALCVAALHPAVLLFSKTAGFHLRDILFPVWSPSQPFENTLGALALYCVFLVVITSYFRLELGRKTWKRLHYTAYAAAALFFTHGLMTDPKLRNSRFNPFDAEKIFVESCLLVVLAAIAFRLKYALNKQPKGGRK